MSSRVSFRTATRYAATLVLVALPLNGCQPRELGWEFQLDQSLDVPARALQAHLIPGSCIEGPNPERPRESVTYRFARGEAPPVAIRSLPPGAWAFEIEALDASCQPIGRGCLELELPTEETSVRIAVAPIAAEASVCHGTCADGLCVDDGLRRSGDTARDAEARAAEDAGPPSRGGDAGPDDASAEDAGATDAAS